MTTYTRWIHPKAEREARDSFIHYHEIEPGRGQRFRKTFRDVVGRILATPLAPAPFEDEYRRRLLPRFPYALIYDIDGTEVRIWAVMHHKRHPDYWKTRSRSVVDVDDEKRTTLDKAIEEGLDDK